MNFSCVSNRRCRRFEGLWCSPSMGLAVGLSVLESGHEGMQLCTPSMTALQVLQDLRKFAMTLTDSFRLSLWALEDTWRPLGNKGASHMWGRWLLTDNHMRRQLLLQVIHQIDDIAPLGWRSWQDKQVSSASSHGNLMEVKCETRSCWAYQGHSTLQQY